MLQLQNLLQKSSKFYTFSQARGYTAGVSQKAARHRWHRGITCCIPPMGLVKLPAEKTHRKTSNHFAHLRVFVYSWVFAAATTASFGKYLMTIFHQPPTEPWNTGWSGRDSQSENPLPRNFPQFRLFSCNIQLAKLTQLLAFRHLHMKSGYPSPSQANKKVLILLIEEILHQVTNWQISKSKVMLNFLPSTVAWLFNVPIQNTQNTRHSRPFSLGRRFLGRDFWTGLQLEQPNPDFRLG